MNFVIGLILLFLLLTAIKQFARMDAAAAARLVRHGGGVIGVIGAVLLLLRGRAGLAAALAGMAASFAGWRSLGPGWTTFRTPGAGSGARGGRVSTARSAMIEMRLDHSSGAMTGAVLSGAYAGRALENMPRPELLSLRAELSRDDPEGVNLLDAYLDRRFAGWRDAEQSEREPGGGVRGAMSRREAYEALGLAEGASATEIIRAHRALMKKFHPDHGGSTALAARVNQAKDVLMQRHG
jgi:DnaJ domain